MSASRLRDSIAKLPTWPVFAAAAVVPVVGRMSVGLPSDETVMTREPSASNAKPFTDSV